MYKDLLDCCGKTLQRISLLKRGKASRANEVFTIVKAYYLCMYAGTHIRGQMATLWTPIRSSSHVGTIARALSMERLPLKGFLVLD